ncbi:S1 RNA-binding domain-containing protein [Carnobacterium inhibens]|uniref:S1 RNA-binding domain-containing protein n=1 Tax=Carnobacterium inhibens TaxID=147709 RepID=UPI0020422099|nr:S1 RNA-binding domain-containing protein [Carnobacterium inhibens]MCM3511432.1 S1 RNA-binding domain-containing protein [Carnobacterium inhibens]
MGIKSLVKKWIGVQDKGTTSTDVAVLERSETVFLEQDKKLNDQIEYAAIFNMIQQEVALTGNVLASQYDEELASDVVKVEVSGIPVVITREELGCTPHNLPLMRYVGETIQFQLIEANEANGLVMGSAKKIKEKEFDKLYQELKDGKQFQAKVTKILRYGAYCVIGDISVQMLNKDFAEDHTTIGDVLEIGDTIDVRFKRITENKNLRVEPLVRYKNGVSVSLTELEPNQVVLGTVRSVKKWGIFVRIAPNLDALCSIPSHLAVREGDKVSFRITQVLKEEKRVRGKIVRLIKKD